MKVLQVALERQNFNLAAHVLVYGLVKAKVEELKKDGKKDGQNPRSSAKESKRS